MTGAPGRLGAQSSGGGLGHAAFTVEALGTYPGGDTYHVVAIYELRDGKVFRGRT